MSEGSCCVSGTRKVRSHLPSERSSTSNPFRSAIVFDNGTYRPTIVETGTERKLFIECYCTSDQINV